VHRGHVVSGEARVGTPVLAEVDVERRRAISRAHTATHLVHTAVRAALGEQATQAGSENSPGRFRFDFAASSAVPASVLAEVEQQINEVALADLEVTAFVTTQDEARRMGAMALFGEKYGDRVRVVEVGDYARELCGGTHAARSGQLGMIKLLSEGSIGSGVRRVEGLVGLDAYSWSAREHVLLAQVAAAFKVPADEVPERVAATVARLREVEKELAQLRAGQVLQSAGAFAAGAEDVGAAWRGSASRRRPAPPATWSARWRWTCAGGSLPTGPLWCWWQPAVSGPRSWRRSTRRGGRAGCPPTRCCARRLRRSTGKGGGKDDVAQGGGTKPAGIPDALTRARELVRRTAAG
jgi:alanyl-tRNA synthetase